ncbi:sensor histidine kinase [Tunturiibacter lichenicola]|uniref:sensor histidine kinase n=1 Tax=Tunturiibacter lichenicola TaxID=2051959 RepID=UPI003D9B7CEE
MSIASRYRGSKNIRRVGYQSIVSLTAILLISLLSYKLDVNLATVSLLLLALVLVTAMRCGFVQAMIVSFGAAGCLDYFFIPPILSLHMSDPKNWVALTIFLFTASVVSRLSSQSQAHARQSDLNSRRMEMLYELSRATLFLDRGQPAGSQMVLLILDTMHVEAVTIFDGNLARLDFAGACSEDDSTLAREAFLQNRKNPDLKTDIWQRPLRLGQHPFGGIVLRGPNLGSGIVDAIASLVAIAFERAQSFEKESRAEAARQTEQLRTAVLDALAHDFKSPLTVIMTASSCLSEMGGLTPEQNEMATLISGQTAELDTLATRLLQKAKLEAEDFKLNKQEVTVSKLIYRALTLKAGRLNGQRVQVSIGSQSIFVRADEELIGTAIGEFVENAAKYSITGSTIQVSALEDASQVLISVHNDGPTIPIEDRSRIFERFYRSRDASYRAAGTGLGLSIVQKAAEAHKGRVWVTSEHEKGTTFFLSLPRIVRRQN